jgi:hypothetical protein
MSNKQKCENKIRDLVPELRKLTSSLPFEELYDGLFVDLEIHFEHILMAIKRIDKEIMVNEMGIFYHFTDPQNDDPVIASLSLRIIEYPNKNGRFTSYYDFSKDFKSQSPELYVLLLNILK